MLIITSTVLLLATPVFVVAPLLRSQLPGLHLFGVEVSPLIPTRFTIEVPWYKEIALPALAVARTSIPEHG